MKTFKSSKGHTYLVFRTLDDSFHIFRELEAKDVAKELGVPTAHTRKMWKKLWKAKKD